LLRRVARHRADYLYVLPALVVMMIVIACKGLSVA
jgi:ABC-type sugar transport system permease subunit